MKMLPLVLVALAVMLVAPSAFACAHCYRDGLYGCYTCEEDSYDGAQGCIINDVIGCAEQYSCDGPDGTEMCGYGPCVHIFNVVDATTRHRQWEVASVKFIPASRKPRTRKA